MIRLNSLLPAPQAELEACVIVPSKNEANELEATLSALAGQVTQNGRRLPKESWEVILLINNSTDGSQAIANKFKQVNPQLALHVVEHDFGAKQANIGHIRKLLMDSAYERLCVAPKPFSLIISTDADTEVAPDWVAQNLAECLRGSEGIGGRISPRTSDLQGLDPQTKRIQLLDARYRQMIAWLEDHCDPQSYDRWPRHYQHFAASFAVRPGVYRQAGGLPPKESLEDVAFYEALARRDVRFRHSPDVSVHTSARLDGRTKIGFAEQLTQWSKGPSEILVPSIRLLETLFTLRQQLRTMWQEIQAGRKPSVFGLKSLAAKCGCPPEQIERALGHQWFGSAFELLNVRKKLESGLLKANAVQPLGEAVQQLEKRFCAMQDQSGSSVEKVQSGIAAL